MPTDRTPEDEIPDTVITAFATAWEAKRQELSDTEAPTGTKTRAGIVAALAEWDRVRAIESAPCSEELHSWKYFRSDSIDSYWIRCTELGPHYLHQDSNTGAQWLLATPKPTPPAPVPAPVCPECVAGKHRNCDGTAWDLLADAVTRCTCTVGGADGHPARG